MFRIAVDRSRGKQARPNAAAPIAKASGVDRAIGACGVLVACSSFAFAAYMTANADHPPPIPGVEYLAIFARPSHSAIAGVESPPPADAPGAPAAVDPTPTGSISDRLVVGAPASQTATPLLARDSLASSSVYKIRDVANGEALVENDIGFRHVRVGDVLPGLGRVRAIEEARQGRWVLRTDAGAALEWTAQAAPIAGDGATAKKTAAH